MLNIRVGLISSLYRLAHGKMTVYVKNIYIKVEINK